MKRPTQCGDPGDRREWTNKEGVRIKELKANQMSITDIAVELDRSPNSVRSFLWRSNSIRKPRDHYKSWTHNEIKKCKRLSKEERLTLEEIAAELKRSLGSVRSCLWRIKKTLPQRHVKPAENTIKNKKYLGCENHPKSKLTNNQVLEIRSLYKPYSKQYNITTLAEKYNVGKTTIWDALKTNTFRNLKNE